MNNSLIAIAIAIAFATIADFFIVHVFRMRLGEHLHAEYQRINSRKTQSETMMTSKGTPISWSVITTSIAPTIGNLTGVLTLVALAIAYAGGTPTALLVIPMVLTPLLLIPMNLFLLRRLLQNSLDAKDG